jgi:hypothetical protein
MAIIPPAYKITGIFKTPLKKGRLYFDSDALRFALYALSFPMMY